MKVKTTIGLEFEVDEKIFDDYEFLETYVGWLNSGVYLPKVVQMTLGSDQKKKLMDKLRGEDGKVPVQKVVSTMNEIFRAINSASTAAKN